MGAAGPPPPPRLLRRLFCCAREGAKEVRIFAGDEPMEWQDEVDKAWWYVNG